MSDVHMKNIVQNIKTVDRAIENIEGLSRLAEPTKRQVRAHIY